MQLENPYVQTATRFIQHDHDAICIAEIKTLEYKVGIIELTAFHWYMYLFDIPSLNSHCRSGLLSESWCIRSRREEYRPTSNSQPMIMSTFDH